MLTIDDFNALLKDPDYNAIPREMMKNSDPSEEWWETYHRFNAACAKMEVWQIATQVVILFEKYPGLIKEARVAFEEKLNGETDYDYPAFFVNDCRLYGAGDIDHNIEQLGESGDAIFEIDGGKVLEDVSDAVVNVMTTVLKSDLAPFRAVFDAPLRSSQQVRNLAKSALGNIGFKIEALIAKKALERKRNEEVERLESEDASHKTIPTGNERENDGKPRKSPRL